MRIMRDYVAARIDLANIGLFVRREIRDGEWDIKEHILEGGSIRRERMQELVRHDLQRFTDTLREMDPRYGRILQDAGEGGMGASAFERLGRELLATILEGARGSVFGPARVLSYLHRREEEARTLAGILSARINNVPPERIREVCGIGR